MGKEDEELYREFARCHPMPSPDDEAIDRLENSEGANGMIIYSFVRFERMKKCIGLGFHTI